MPVMNEADYLSRLMQIRGQAIDPSGNTIDLNRPIVQNDDGSFSTERSITIQHGGLNGGRPTNIPTIWEGKELPFEEAINRAVTSKKSFPGFNSIKDAVKAAEERSAAIGRIRGEESEPLPGPLNQEEDVLEKFMNRRMQ